MWRALVILIVVINTSTITLSDAMLVVEDEAIELGDIAIGESRSVEIEDADSVRVVFRLGDDWIGTGKMLAIDTVEISDNIETFEVEIDFVD